MIKILVVDDDLKVLSILSKTFTTMIDGYLVLTATSANAGLNMLKNERPEVVVLDIRLGPESGMDLLKDFAATLEVRGIQRKPRFVVITAYPDEEVRREALEKYKVDAFVMKPFEPKEIQQHVLRSILHVLNRERETVLALLSKEDRENQKKRDVIQKL